MRKIRTTLFYFFFYSWTIIFFVVFSPVKFFTRNFVVKLSNIWSFSVNFLCEKVLGVKVNIYGKNNIPQDRSILVASNHQSAWETFFFTFLFNDPIFILKEELRFIPIMSWYFKKLGFIFIDRKKGLNSLRHIISSMKKLKDDSPKTFIIFPEGTRMLPGEKKDLLTSGVFAIKKNLNLPVIPVKHNSGEYWHNKRFLKTQGTIQVSIFPELKSLDKEVFLNELKMHFYSKKSNH
jgi:1-acyl-sn-glycerol-3-phosphate acyltransferase